MRDEQATQGKNEKRQEMQVEQQEADDLEHTERDG